MRSICPLSACSSGGGVRACDSPSPFPRRLPTPPPRPREPLRIIPGCSNLPGRHQAEFSLYGGDGGVASNRFEGSSKPDQADFPDFPRLAGQPGKRIVG